MTNAPQLSVIAPCYNEAGNLPELVTRIYRALHSKSISAELILVNDASSDDTPSVLDSLRSTFPELHVVTHSQNQGIVAGWRSGLRLAKGIYVCLIDADLQNQPEDIPRLYRELMSSNADMVQGFRSSIGRLKDNRFILSKSLNFLLNFLFSMRMRDNKSGFILCRKQVLEHILDYRMRYRFFQTFIAVAAHTHRYSIREIETLFESRLIGQSFIPKLPIRVLFGVCVDILKALWEYRLCFRPKTIEGEILKKYQVISRSPRMSSIRRLWLEVYALTTPIHHWMVSRRFLQHFDELRVTQWLSRDSIAELQLKKLQRLISHAYLHVPYYRELFDVHGVHPKDIVQLSDLAKIPLLDKGSVKKNLFFDLLSDNHDKRHLLRITTSGSTGEPLVCFADRSQLEMRMAATLRGMEWAGYRFGDRQARLWHQTIGMSPGQVIREHLDGWFCRRRFLPAYEMTEESIRQWISEMREYRPVFIDGYAESFNFLANYLDEKGIAGFCPKGIMSSAQILPRQSREIIEKVFGCRVFDKYGSREFSGIAYECDAHEGHHVVAENFIVEVLKDGMPAQEGEIGEVVVTDLNNFSQPFIRYRIGDLVVAMDNTKVCACGRALPRIGDIQGRLQSIIRGANGSFIPGTFFAHLFKDYEFAVSQYQVVQFELGNIKLKIVKGSRFHQKILEEILEVLYQYLGKQMIIDVEYVDSVPLGRTGKRTSVISYIEAVN